MSSIADTAIRASLAGHAPLTALVANRIAHDAAEQKWGPPFIAIERTETEEQRTLSGELMGTRVVYDVSCWSKVRAEANTVADAAAAAILDAQQEVTNRSSAYDPDTDLVATVITVEWWLDPPDDA